MTNNKPTEAYWKEFLGQVYELLGGIDMATEFFKAHPEQRRDMRAECRFHFNKGGTGTAQAGANIYFKQNLKRILQEDRAQATKKPIPKRRP